MIHITIKATGMELTPAIRAYIEEKISSVEKFIDPSDDAAHADVEVGQTTHHHQKGEVFRAEISFHSKQADVRVVKTEENLYAAIDEAKDELLDEIRDQKDKRVGAVRRGQRLWKGMLRRFGWGEEE